MSVYGSICLSSIPFVKNAAAFLGKDFLFALLQIFRVSGGSQQDRECAMEDAAVLRFGAECRSVFLTAGFFRDRGRCRYILKSDSFRDSSKDLIFSADFHDINA